MKQLFTASAALALVILLCAVAFADNQASMDTPMLAKVGDQAPNFTLKDAHGKTHSLSDFKGKFVVLEWVNFGCPFVKKHYESGNMQKLQKTFTGKDVVWLSICSSAPGKQGYLRGDELTKAIANHKHQGTAYLIDADGTVGRMYQAKTTPNMYVVNPEGVLVYAGAIDDNPSPKPEVIASSTNYVSAALNQAMAGKTVKVSATQPYGCSVKYAKK